MTSDLREAVVAFAAAGRALVEADVDQPSPLEVLELYTEIETTTRSVPAVGHAILNRLDREVAPSELGATSLWKALVQRCRISKGDALRRIAWARLLGPRRAINGEALAPHLEHTAAVQSKGLIGDGHVQVIKDFFEALPDGVDLFTRIEAERTLAGLATRLDPNQLGKTAEHLMAYLNPDGTLSNDDRHRRRGLTLGKQQPDGMSRLAGWITPEFRALLEPLLVKFRDVDPRDPDGMVELWADGAAEGGGELVGDEAAADDEPAGGDAVPVPVPVPVPVADDAPEADATPMGDAVPAADDAPAPGAGPVPRDQPALEDAAVPAADDAAVPAADDAPKADAMPAADDAPEADPFVAAEPTTSLADAELAEPLVDKLWRSTAQRTHDAVMEMARMLLRSKNLGQLNGLPMSVVVTTTLQELERGTGYAVTAGGSHLPIPDLIRMAAQAHHYLAVFDKHTSQALYLGRAQRCATGAQKLVLFARDRGCTCPGCDAAAYATQAHHGVADWKHDGQTNVDDMTLACGSDNQMIESTEWTTRRRADGRFEWIPPPEFDFGQPRINYTHHPERLLAEGGDDPP